MATAEEFFAIELRVGTVTRAEPFPEARKPSGRSAQVLMLGAMPSPHEVVLLEVERPVENGTRIG
jgi:hypothetical protein